MREKESNSGQLAWTGRECEERRMRTFKFLERPGHLSRSRDVWPEYGKPPVKCHVLVRIAALDRQGCGVFRNPPPEVSPVFCENQKVIFATHSTITKALGSSTGPANKGISCGLWQGMMQGYSRGWDERIKGLEVNLESTQGVKGPNVDTSSC